MNIKRALQKQSGILLFGGAILALFMSSFYSYLLFHSVAEVFSIVIACGIFMFAWNSRRLMENNYLLVLGVAYLFIGTVDFLHTLSYKGMNIFEEQGANLPTQLWILGRYMESVTFLLAAIWLRGRPVGTVRLFGGYFAATALCLAAIFHWDLFPVCYQEGVGLTPFKKISEYLISLMLALAVVLLFRKRRQFDPGVFRLLVSSLVLTIFSELSFTFYIDVYGISNLIGHLFKILSFFLIYKAIIETGLLAPYQVLFRDLQESKAALEASEKQYRQLFSSMISGFAVHEMIWDEAQNPVDYRFMKVNPAFEKLTGLKQDQVIGKRVRELLPQIEPGWIESYGEVVKTGIPRHMENHAGELGRYYEAFAFRIAGNVFAVTFNDITERKQAEAALKQFNAQLEDRVRERTRELAQANAALEAHALDLERSNRDLREFAFVASHDLQEPLRKIQTFCDLLLKRYRESLDARGADYLDRMQKSAGRMRDLVVALLNFHRITLQDRSLAPVDLGQVVEEVTEDLEVTIARTGARVEVGELAVIEADPHQLRQLFQNLISNSIKFCRQRPEIQIYGKRLENGRLEIHVTDNGIGFEEKFRDRIFRPFQRLHPRQSFPGTGIGLSICRKVVESHRGDITVKSVPDQGTTVIVTLPVRQAEPAKETFLSPGSSSSINSPN